MEKNSEVKRTWRDSVFRYLFKENENFVQMYEIFTGKKLLPDEVEFKDTDSIVMSKDLKNDIAFLTDTGDLIILIEHQHTKNLNMGLRMLIYYAELLKMHVVKHGHNIYGQAPIDYPKAEFYVAYTGKTPWVEDNAIICGDISMNIKLVDIKFDNLTVRENTNTLSGYAYLLKQYEYYLHIKKLTPTSAVHQAFKDCRHESYLMDYINEEEFLTMVTEVFTIEKQAEEREKWAREEERKKAEEAIYTVEKQAEEREKWAREEERKKAEETIYTVEKQAEEREKWAREEERKKAEKQAEEREKWARKEESTKNESNMKEIIKKLLSNGINIDIISASMAISKEEILKLQTEIKNDF